MGSLILLLVGRRLGGELLRTIRLLLNDPLNVVWKLLLNELLLLLPAPPIRLASPPPCL